MTLLRSASGGPDSHSAISPGPSPERNESAADHKSVTVALTPTLRDPVRPARVGPYTPHIVLGSGGMATVYLASGGAQLGTRRWCALKVLHDKLNDRENYLSMFFNEARIASEISHPHVCSVFDYGCVEGQAYLAMDYLRGKSLAAVARACGRIDDPDRHARSVARILADACEGLSAIHEHHSAGEAELRVVHRDISPDNLILGFDGFVKVIDFGLAKIRGRGEKTRSGILKGKVSYIAPELLGGDSATPSADIWSLGVVAWELLTGKRLFRKDSDSETLRALAEQPVLRPSEVLPGLPGKLDAVLLRALARDPRERYETATEFGAALWHFLRSHGELMQHRELGAWLSQLFPGEEAKIRDRVESMPHTPPLAALSPLPARSAAPGGLRLLQRLQGSAGGAVLTRRPSRWLAAGVVAAACFGWGAFKWSSARGVALGAERSSDAAPAPARGEASGSRAPPSLGHAQSASGFTVEVERADDASEVTVHVRRTPPSDRPGARHAR